LAAWAVRAEAATEIALRARREEAEIGEVTGAVLLFGDPDYPRDKTVQRCTNADAIHTAMIEILA